MKIFTAKTKILGAILIYLILTIIFAWPLLGNFNNSIFGVQNDTLGTLWGLWWTKKAILDLHIFPATSNLIAAPFGIIIPYFFPWNYLIALPIVAVWGAIPAFNFLSLMGFVLTGLAMYLLAIYFTKNFWASVIAGAILAFSPYHLVNAQSFLDLGQIEWLVFYLYFLFRLKDRPNAFNLIFANIFCLITLFSSHYYAVFTVFLTILFIIIYSIINWRKIKLAKLIKPRINLIILINFIVIAVFLLLAFIVFNRNLNKVNLPSFDDIMNFGSVKWWYYLLPSMEHPIFGKWVSSHIVGISFAAQTHYLGYITILLSFFALCYKKNWKKFIFFIVAALLALLFSLPPKIHFGHLIVNMPSYYLFEFLPFVRFVSRFSLIVMIGLTILSAAAIDKLIRNKKIGAQIAVLVCVIVLFLIEFLPNFVTTKLHQLPEAYQFLKNQPGDFSIVEYPFFPNSPWMWEQMYFQTEHQKSLLNNFEFKSKNEEAFKHFYGAIENITEPTTPYFLKLLGTQYVVIHLKNQEEMNDGTIRRNTLANLERIKNIAGLKLVKEAAEADIFEIKNPLPVVSIANYPLLLKNGKDMIFFKNKLKNAQRPEDIPAIFTQTNQKQDDFIKERAINNLFSLDVGEMDFNGHVFTKNFDAPKTDEPRDYRLILDKTNEKEIGSVEINNKKIKDVVKSTELMTINNQLTLRPTRVEANIFTNPSFENKALWGQVWNLTIGKEGEDKSAKAEQTTDATEGKYSLKLTSENGTMASMRQEIKNIDPNSLYLISFDYKHLQGAKPRYAILEDTGTNDSKIENIKTGEWQHLQILYRPKPNTRFAALEFYSDSWADKPSINLYDNVKVTKIDLNINDVILEPILPPANPKIEITFEQKNENNYQVTIKNAKDPFFLVFLKPFFEKWQLGSEKNHFQVDGYAHAWYLEKQGDYQLELTR